MTSNLPVPSEQHLPATPLQESVAAWSLKVTNPDSPRAAEFRRNAQWAVGSFLHYFGFEEPEQLFSLTEANVTDYIHAMQTQGYAQSTIYNRISRVSSFLEWLNVPHNPITKRIRPDVPKPYQSEGVRALSDEELIALIEHVQALAACDPDPKDRYEKCLTHKRNYAMLLFYVYTGKRESEILHLRRGQMTLNRKRKSLVMDARHKGGVYASSELAEPSAIQAMYDYLKATGRDFNDMGANDPIWLSHGTRAKEGEPLKHRQQVYRWFQEYCVGANIGRRKVHDLRHTFARLVGEEAEDISEVQHALGHANRETTSHYMKRIQVKRDKFSGAIRRRLYG